MKILYLSHILSIHDYRFLDKLLSNNHDVLLVALDKNEIPEIISSLKDLKTVLIPRPLPKHNMKYYFSIRSILLALIHLVFRIIQNSTLLKKLISI